VCSHGFCFYSIRVLRPRLDFLSTCLNDHCFTCFNLVSHFIYCHLFIHSYFFWRKFHLLRMTILTFISKKLKLMMDSLRFSPVQNDKLFYIIETYATKKWSTTRIHKRNLSKANRAVSLLTGFVWQNILNGKICSSAIISASHLILPVK